MAHPVGDKLTLPERKYCNGGKKLVSVRIHQKLVNEIYRIAKEKQWDFSEVVMTALDDFAQSEQKQKHKRKQCDDL